MTPDLIAKLTPWFIVVPALLIGGWACVANWMGRHENTVSATITRWSYAAPMLPFGLGVLIGHFLW